MRPGLRPGSPLGYSLQRSTDSLAGFKGAALRWGGVGRGGKERIGEGGEGREVGTGSPIG